MSNTTPHQVALLVCKCKTYDEVVKVADTYKISWFKIEEELSTLLPRPAYGHLQYIYWYASGLSIIEDDAHVRDVFHEYAKCQADIWLKEQSDKAGVNLDV